MGPAFSRKYATGTGADVYLPMVKRAVVDFAVSADWTPAAGDVKVSKDGAAAANIGTLPVAVAMGNTAMWKFVFSDAELTCRTLAITIADTATKAVEDSMFLIETYGNSSARWVTDIFDVALAAIADAVWDEVQSGHTTAGTFGKFLDSAVSAVSTGGLTAADIAAAVWDLATSGHTTSGTFGAQLKTLLDTVAGYIDTEVAAIKAKTDNLPASPAATSDVPSAATIAAAVWDLATSGHATSGTFGAQLKTLLDTVAGYIDTEVAAIKAKTDNLPADPAGVSDLSGVSAPSAATVAAAVWDLATSGHVTSGTFGAQLKTLLDTVAGYIDTEVAAIKAKTDNLPASPAASGDIISAATIAAAVWDLATSGHVTSGTFGAQLKTLLDTVAGYIDTEVAAIKAKTDNLGASPAAVGSAMTLTSGERNAIAAALLDLTDGIETGETLRQATRLMRAALLGKSDGFPGGPVHYRDKADAVNRVTAVVDADGNRTSVSINAA